MGDYGAVYALSLDGKTFRYVGMTKRGAENRLRGHLHDALNGSKYPVHRWIRKHGGENIIATVLCSAHIVDLPAAERWWIAELRELHYDLLNLTDGGDGTFGHVKTPEGRARIGAAHRGKKLTDEHKAKIRVSGTGRKHSDVTRAAISKAHTGRKFSPEHIEAIRASHTGKKLSEEHKRAASEGRTRARAEGRVRSAASYALAAEKRRGYSHSDETKAKISAAMRRRHASTS